MSSILSHNKLSSCPLEKGVYQLPCKDCNSVYIGETGRKLSTRIKEHKKDIRNDKPFSAIANHANNELHEIDFENGKIIYPCSDLVKRRIVESSLIINSDNCLNLNKGFCPMNRLICNAICQCLDLSL